MNVFISHASADDPFVDRLAAALERAGVIVWHDKANLRGGNRFGPAIQAAIDQADAIIVVVSNDSIKSDWVNGEIEYARAQRKPIIPLRLASAPSAMPPNLSSLTYIDFSTQFAKHVLDLLAALNVPPPVNKRPRRNRRTLVALASFLVIAVILVLVITHYVQSNNPTEKASEDLSTSVSTPVTATNLPSSPTFSTDIPLSTEPSPTIVTPQELPSPTNTEAILIEEAVTLFFAYPSPSYFVIRIDPTAIDPVNITGLKFEAQSPSGKLILALTDFSTLTDLIQQLDPGTCIVFYDGVAPAQVANCQTNNTFPVPLQNPAEQQFWLQETSLFTVYRTDRDLGKCATTYPRQTCQMEWY